MKSRRVSVPLAAFALLTCASIAFFINFGQQFPPAMALPFGVGPVDRVKFIVIGSFVSLMAPTFLAATIGVLPRVLASRQPAVKLDTLLWAGLWSGAVLQAALLSMNIAIYRANLP